MIVCICNNITDREIRQAVRLGASDLAALRSGLGVATQCGKCESCAEQILEDERAISAAASRRETAGTATS